MNRDMEKLLSESLDQLENGASINEILGRYPEEADGLRPYLTCWPFMRDQLLARLREEALMAQNQAIWDLIADLDALEPDAEALPPDMSAGLPVMSL